MQEKILFKDSEGNKVVGILSNPTRSKEKPIIIMCHGSQTDKGAFHITRLEEIFNKEGISTFRFDFFGHGESDGKYEDLTISKAVDDILRTIDFLKKKGYSKIGLTGSSFGGMAALLVAARTKDLYILALKSPVSDYLERMKNDLEKYPLDKWKREGFIYKKNNVKMNYSFFEDAKKINSYEEIKKIKIPTLIVQGDKDESLLLGQGKKTASVIENCKLEIIDGADHDYSKKEDFEKMLKLISEFIIKNS